MKEHDGAVTRYVRCLHQERIVHGILEGETVRELAGNFLAGAGPTGRSFALADARLLPPCAPSKVLAVGRNYRSHLRDRPEPGSPGLFAKFPTSIIGPDEAIVFPPGAEEVHYEGEMVLVIGRTARRIGEAEVREHIFGITAGNDVSERRWQKEDLQWFRAKASDTFGPLGPVVARGLDYDDLQLTTRVNGEVRQSQRTSDLIFPVARIVSYASQFVTLEPGDVIYTGTPGNTRALQPGDVVEVEVEGVGILRNPVG
jgi:2-keto-4-pentenoate hydratase/2-oxohepta-3-ene-1,7-dioic acid hydratase in catechol pathway